MQYTISATDLLTKNPLGQFLFNLQMHEIEVKIAEYDYVKKYRSSVRWDFGDGTIKEGVSAKHSYTKGGKYVISATLYTLDRKAVTNVVKTITVNVKEVIPTELSVIDIEKWQKKIKNCYICKNNNLGDLLLTVGNDFDCSPTVKFMRKWYKAKSENSYNDVKDKDFYHLQKYYTFLIEDNVILPDKKIKTSILRPGNRFTPKYNNIFGRLLFENNKLKLDAYYVKSNIKKDKDILLNVYKDNFGNRETIIAKAVNSINDIPDECELIGKFGIVPVWYKNDYDNSEVNTLVFEIDRSTLKLRNEKKLRETYLNIPPLGINVIFKKAENSLISLLTLNGLYGQYSNESSPLKIEKHLQHNLYLDYTIKTFLGNYIENDKLSDNSETLYNLYKSGEVQKIDSGNTFVSIEEQDVKDDIKYYKIYSITPKKDNFSIKSNGQIVYQHGKLTDLESLVIPSEKRHKEDIDRIINSYTIHPMFENAVNLKRFLKEIFDNNDMLSYIMTKNYNFLDDTVNHKTCYIKNLISIYSLLDEPLKQYNINYFERVNELNDLTRILSMNYSHLFGTIINDLYDIEITPFAKGKNVADELKENDVILCDENYKIIGFRRDTEIYQLSTPTEYIIVQDDYTSKTKLVSFYDVPSYEIEEFDDQSESWILANGEFIDKVKYSYSLNNYDYQWGWSLILPSEIDNVNNKSQIISSYYSFFLFNPQIEPKRLYNFLEESTMPMVDGKQISKEEWEKNFGFAHDCIMKILTDKLELK